MTLDEAILAEAKQARDKLLDLQNQAEHARLDYHHEIRRLNAAGGSLREIADALGLSHQRVHQIVEGESPGPPMPFIPPFSRGRGKHGRGFFTLTGPARELVAGAQEEADRLRHDYIGTEHLLLALVAAADTPAGRALQDLGVDLEATRSAVVARVGEGTKEPRRGRRPFTPKSKRVLELALREALSFGHNYIGTEHILLGLLAEDEGMAAEILAEFGVDSDKVRRSLFPGQSPR
jgi:hypothetical protein